MVGFSQLPPAPKGCQSTLTILFSCSTKGKPTDPLTLGVDRCIQKTLSNRLLGRSVFEAVLACGRDQARSRKQIVVTNRIVCNM